MKQDMPDRQGHFGAFGGRYVAETLMPALIELEEAYRRAAQDPEFRREFLHYLHDYAGRETPLYFAENLTAKAGGAKIYLKREDLNHTGAHKINNTLGQALLARRMGKKRVIAETGATSIREMGQVMKTLIPRLQGRATGDQASQAVRKLLQ